eukprot:1415489-Pyramimonas_sp.AAC.1
MADFGSVPMVWASLVDRSRAVGARIWRPSFWANFHSRGQSSAERFSLFNDLFRLASSLFPLVGAQDFLVMNCVMVGSGAGVRQPRPQPLPSLSRLPA